MKPAEALTYPIDADFGEAMFCDAVGILSKGMNTPPLHLSYHLTVHPRAAMDTVMQVQRLVKEFGLLMPVSTDADYEDVWEWCLTAYQVKGGEMIFKQFWSPGA